MDRATLADFRLPPTKANDIWEGDARVVVCFGDRCLRGRLLKLVRGLNTEPVLTLESGRADIEHENPDLASLVRVYASGEPSAPDVSTLIFTGYVESLAWNKDIATVQASTMPGLRERRLGGFAVAGMQPGEMFWSLARIGGFTPGSIRIGGPWPPPTEEFFVVAPVDGVDFEFPEKVGDVTFTNDEGVRQQWTVTTRPPASGGPDLRTEFMESRVAAVTTVSAAMVLDAEEIGLSRIQAAASRLALIGRHSLPLGLNRKTRDFSRRRLLERVHVRRIVGVLAKRSQRQWLRGIDTPEDDELLTGEALTGMRDALRRPLDVRTAEAIRAWRRAIRSEPASAVVALVEALEFYVAETSVPPLFSQSDLENVHDLVSGVQWSAAQEQRLLELIGRLNEAPFFVRMRAAVVRDGLKISNAEAELLRKDPKAAERSAARP